MVWSRLAKHQLMVGSRSAQVQKLYSLPVFKRVCLYQGWRSLHDELKSSIIFPQKYSTQKKFDYTQYSLITFWIFFKKEGLSPSAAWLLYQISWSWSHRVGCRSSIEVCTFKFKICSSFSMSSLSQTGAVVSISNRRSINRPSISAVELIFSHREDFKTKLKTE